MGCGSSSVAPANRTHVDNSHFRAERIIGKGGFGTIHYVTLSTDRETGFARKSQLKHEVVKNGSGVRMVRAPDPHSQPLMLTCTYSVSILGI
jgi:hypothetical protein